MGLGWLVIGSVDLLVVSDMHLPAIIWILLGVSYLGSGLATLRWGDRSRRRYPVRWNPFWPPDDDER